MCETRSTITLQLLFCTVGQRKFTNGYRTDRGLNEALNTYFPVACHIIDITILKTLTKFSLVRDLESAPQLTKQMLCMS